MLAELLRSVSLFHILHQIDRELAQTCRQAGCPYCQGRLHLAPYFRKPRGGSPGIPEQYQQRLSLCCGRESCRRRVLPPSCLFMGRRVYWNAVILIVVTLGQGRVKGMGSNQLMRMFAIPRKTLIRWLHFFRHKFAATPQWQRLRGRIRASISDRDLPGSLVEHFLAHSPAPLPGLARCLVFLAIGQVE